MNTTRNSISKKMLSELETTQFVPKKQLGQVFLLDPNIIRKIITVCDLQKNETVVEIGAGAGALTQSLAKNVKRVIAIETDRQLAEKLRCKLEGCNVDVIRADFLDYDIDSFPDSAKIIGNLPYYISTPIIAKVLTEHKNARQFFCMVQWEYGRRLVAQPGTKEYGSFSCFAQYYSDVQMLFKIQNTSFRPVPKVNSCFLKFDMRPPREPKAENDLLLFKIIRTAFQQRRKTILNTIGQLYDKKILAVIFATLSINPQARAENISVADFVRISNALDRSES